MDPSKYIIHFPQQFNSITYKKKTTHQNCFIAMKLLTCFITLLKEMINTNNLIPQFANPFSNLYTKMNFFKCVDLMNFLISYKPIES